MTRFLKLQNKIFKIKDIVLIQVNKDLITIYTTTASINLDYSNDDIDEALYNIYDIIKDYFLTTFSGDFLNVNYISSAEFYEFEDGVYLKYLFNEKVKVQYPNIIYLDKKENITDEIKENIFTSIGESDYQFFMSLY